MPADASRAPFNEQTYRFVEAATSSRSECQGRAEMNVVARRRQLVQKQPIQKERNR
jgi:hypothetical protein